MAREEVLYLLHFDTPLEGGRQPRHYLGHTFASILDRRLDQHLSGHKRGSRLVQHALREGREVTVAKVWSGDYYEEKRLKKAGKNFAKICPLCQAERRLQELETLAVELAQGAEVSWHVLEEEGLVWFGEWGIAFLWASEWGKHKEGRWEKSTRDPADLLSMISQGKLVVAYGS